MAILSHKKKKKVNPLFKANVHLTMTIFRRIKNNRRINQSEAWIVKEYDVYLLNRKSFC